MHRWNGNTVIHREGEERQGVKRSRRASPWNSLQAKEPRVHPDLLHQEMWPHLLPLGPIRYSSHPLSTGDTIQDPQWMPEITDRTKLYIHSWPLNNNTDLKCTGPLTHGFFFSINIQLVLHTHWLCIHGFSQLWMDHVLAYNLQLAESNTEGWL